MIVDQPFKQPRLLTSQAHFSQVPDAQITRSVFNRSHTLKTTFDCDYLIPIYCDEVLPGDSFKMNVTTFARLATPLTPIMDNLYCDVHFWFVPNRLLWTNWERMNGAQDNPDDTTDYTVPVVATPMAGYAEGTLFDYFGIPVGVAGLSNINALHSRAYNLIYNTWYRDQNLQDSVVVDIDDGSDDPDDYVLLKRGKRHDYFTSCLPWTQKGPDVLLPLGDYAPVAPMKGDGVGGNTFAGASDGLPLLYWGANGASHYEFWRQPSANTTTPQNEYIVNTTVANTFSASGYNALPPISAWGDQFQGAVDSTYLAADLSGAVGPLVDALREAVAFQRMFERDARGGTRYVEVIRAHFNVVSPDFRLQRPEYLGGGSTMINTSPIPQTSGTSASGTTTPLGNLAAMGTFSHRGAGFSKSFVEHGVILGIISARADLTYQQGLNRMWSRQTRFDYYWPALSHLGEMAVLNQEIFAQGTGGGSDDLDVFGYQEAFADYRYKPSLITGLFRSDATGSLDVWHLAEDFSGLPVLDASFIVQSTPLDRAIAVPSQPHFLLDVAFDLKCARAMPVYSVPGLMDHF